MKKLNWFLLVMLFMLIPTLQSCDDDDGYSLGQFAYTMATVRVIGGDAYYLDSDSFGTLAIAATNVYWYKPVDGQRVIVRFNPLYDNYNGYDIGVKLEALSRVLTKQIEVLTAENEAEFGNDPVDILRGNMWISNGYMNVIFQQNIPIKNLHRVSLVRNMIVEEENDGYIHLEYRYNTYSDTSGIWKDGAVSFNLNSLDFEGKKGIKVKLNSSVNGEVEVKFDFKESTPEPDVLLKFDMSNSQDSNLK